MKSIAIENSASAGIFSHKKTAQAPLYQHSILALVDALHLQQFIGCNDPNMISRQAVEAELLRITESVVSDSLCAGTKFVRLPVQKDFGDGKELHFNLNVLINKEAQLVKLHSIEAFMVGSRRLFLANRNRLDESPHQIREILEAQMIAKIAPLLSPPADKSIKRGL